MATLTWAQLRHMLCRRIGDHVAGTATGGGVTTLVDATRRKEVDNFWKAAWCKVYSGTGSGQERPLSASTQSSGTLTHAATPWTAPDATSLYEVHRFFAAAEYDEYLKESLRWHTRTRRLVAPTVDTSLTWTTDQYDYTVPTGMVGIEKVEFSTETGAPDTDEYEFKSVDAWDIRRSSTRKLYFNKPFGQPVSGTVIRLTGVSEFADPTADTDTYNLDGQPIVELALVYASAALCGVSPTAKWEKVHQMAMARHEATLARLTESVKSGIRWVEPY